MSAALQASRSGMSLRPAQASRKSLRVQAKAAAKTTKAKASNAPYVCVDCGYLYDGKKGSFEDLPKNYACPVCGAPKPRFKQFLGNVSRSNDNKTMSSRRDSLREQLEERGETVGEDAGFLYVTAASAAVFLGLVYYFTSVAR